jgi:hypothetical protein
MKKLLLAVFTIVCVAIATSGCTNTGPAVDTGGQMNNMVVATTPIPTATVAAAKTTVATSSSTTVVTTVPTTASPATQATATPVWKYDEITMPETNGFGHYIVIDNKGSTPLKKELEVTWTENKVSQERTLSVNVPPGERESYLIVVNLLSHGMRMEVSEQK